MTEKEIVTMQKKSRNNHNEIVTIQKNQEKSTQFLLENELFRAVK